MNTATQFIREEEPSILFRLIKGGQYHSDKKEKRIQDFWAFCHATFWPNEDFSVDEETTFLKLISQHFHGTALIDRRFMELIERAAMAKRFIDQQPGRYVARPSEWLNVHFQFGLAGTQDWYNKVSEQRRTVPTYRQGLKMLAKGILNYCRTQDKIAIQVYRQAFIEEKQKNLLAIYTNAISHMHFYHF